MDKVINKFKKLTIVNFQSHKNTVIDFEENGINALKGKSDNGKSAIIRAIKFVVTNQPTGDSFVSDWVPRTPKGNVPKGNAEVTLETTLGYVRRVKGKDNLYFLKTNDMEEEQQFENFGSGKVPIEIRDFFNFSDINIQEQKDTHFLLNDNPSTVAKFINTIMDMEIVDKSTSNVNSMVRAAKSLKDTKVATIESVTKQLEPFERVDSCDSMLSRIEKKQGSADKSERYISSIVNLVDSKKLIGLKQSAIIGIIGQNPMFNAVRASMKATIDAENGISFMDSKNTELKKVSSNLAKCEAVMAHYGKTNAFGKNVIVLDSMGAEVARIENLKVNSVAFNNRLVTNEQATAFNTTRLTNKNKMYGKALEELKRLEELQESYAGTTKRISSNKEAIKIKEAEYLEIRGDECPTCKKPW